MIIDDFQNELKSFLVAAVNAEKFDVVVPVMRKGLFLLENLFPTDRQFEIFLLDLPPNLVLDGKRILLFDDSARTGRTLHDARENIMLRSPKKSLKIRVGVFMKHKSCRETIDYWGKEFDDDNAAELYGCLSDYFDSLCHQLDPDHLVIRTCVSKIDGALDKDTFLRDMEQILAKKGRYYLQDSVCSLWGRSKFAVADLNPAEYGLDSMKSFWAEEGVCKVRFCLEPSNALYTVPIFCPEITPPKDGNCASVIQTRFCSGADPPDEIRCRDCINFALTERLAQKFIPQLKEELLAKNYKYEITEMTWPEIQLRYTFIEDKLFSNLNARVLGS